jgi:hypothetical protein
VSQGQAPEFATAGAPPGRAEQFVANSATNAGAAREAISSQVGQTLIRARRLIRLNRRTRSSTTARRIVGCASERAAFGPSFSSTKAAA